MGYRKESFQQRKVSSEDILKNLIFYRRPVSSLNEGLKQLRKKELEVIYIIIENANPETFHKKKYFQIYKREAPCKLDAWIYKNMVDKEAYSKLLKKYAPLKTNLKFDDIDEYILEKHYRKKAIKILKTRVKHFELAEWLKPRFKYEYRRKTNLRLKDDTPFMFDFRNYLETLFILKHDKDKFIMAVGGSGSSQQRFNYSLYTALFYLLGHTGQRITYHLLKYTGFNRFIYIKTLSKPIVTINLGSNHQLDEKLREEIRKNSLELSTIYTSLSTAANLRENNR